MKRLILFSLVLVLVLASTTAYAAEKAPLPLKASLGNWQFGSKAGLSKIYCR